MRFTGYSCLLLLAYICCIATAAAHVLGSDGHLNHQWKKREVQCEDSKLVVNPTRNATHVKIITDSGKILLDVDNTNTTEREINDLLMAISPVRAHYSDLNSSNYHIFTKCVYKPPNGRGFSIEIFNELNSTVFEKQFYGSNGGLSDEYYKCIHITDYNLILESGLDVNHRDGYNKTLLIWAALFGNEKITKDLVEKGTNVNTPGSYGFIPLLAAIISGKGSLVEYLIKHGARVNERVSRSRATPIHLAVAIGQLNIVRILLDNGAEVSSSDDAERATPLHYAISEKHIDVAKELIARGSDVNAKANNGNTPLHGAIIIMNEELIHLLLQKGADVNSRDNKGITPLIVAILEIKNEDSCLKIVKHLIEHHNPDLNIKDNDGKTALSRASERRFGNVINYLKAHGAI